MSRKKKRTRKKKKLYSIELTGILLIFLAILAFGEFGFVGEFLANIIKVFLGKTYQLFTIILSILGVYYIFKGKSPKVKRSPFLGITLLYLTILLGLHLNMFKPIMEADINILSASWRNLKRLFDSTIPVQNIGGGMIGAVLYAASYFLFENIGSYIL
ncbi:MAG: cell division protein FtsK, partial [Atopostipes suicloacalis]|nr:cell division protein FtsK [Atopostipes suicloacalis]